MSNNNSLLHLLRKSREKPNVLRDRILKAMSENDKIMVFEGIDDAPVYEEWAVANSDCNTLTH